MGRLAECPATRIEPRALSQAVFACATTASNSQSGDSTERLRRASSTLVNEVPMRTLMVWSAARSKEMNAPSRPEAELCSSTPSWCCELVLSLKFFYKIERRDQGSGQRFCAR